MKFNSEVIIFSLFSVHLTYTTRNEESSMKNARSILFSPLEATQAFGMEIVDHPSLSLARLTRMSFVYSFFFFLLQIAGLVKYLKCYKPHLTSFIYLFWEYNWKCSENGEAVAIECIKTLTSVQSFLWAVKRKIKCVRLGDLFCLLFSNNPNRAVHEHPE